MKEHARCPKGRLAGVRVEVGGIGEADRGVVVIARHHLLGHRPNPVATRIWVGPVAHDIPQAKDPIHALPFHVLQDRLQSLQVAVNV
jgi:hypothetical protein